MINIGSPPLTKQATIIHVKNDIIITYHEVLAAVTAPIVLRADLQYVPCTNPAAL